MKMISTWMGVPISEMPREELEEAFIMVNQQLERERNAHCEASIREIGALAALVKERNRTVIGWRL